MIVSPMPVTPASVSTTTSAAVRSKGAPVAQNGSPLHEAVTGTERTPVTRIGVASAGRVDDEIAGDRRDVHDPAHAGVLGETLAEGVKDAGHAVGPTDGHAPHHRSTDEH